MTPIHRELGDRLTRAHAALRQSVESFPWQDRALYIGWLVQTHAYVSHTPRLLALAAARLPYGREEMRKQLLGHALAELGHERLAEEDLRALGTSLARHPILPQTTAFYQSLYHQVEYDSPFAVVGRGLVLERVGASSARIRARVSAVHGADTVKFLAAHGEDDEAHVDTTLRALVDVTSDDASAIMASMDGTVVLYRTILDAIIARPET